MDRERRWWELTGPGWAVDTTLMLGVGVIQVYTSWGAGRVQPHARPLDLLAYLLLAGTALALAARRRHPGWMLALTVAGTVGYFAGQYPYALSPLAALVAVSLAIRRGRRAAGWAAASCLVVVPVAAALLLARNPDDAAAALMWSLVVVVVGQLAEVSRARQDHTREVERRLVAAEHGREEEALRRAHEERLRIARELHDVTSHTISVIALQAAAATEAVDRADGREQVRASLGAIRTASRQAMAEMTATLGVLRPDRGAGPRRPMPGVAGLRDLAAPLHGTGVRVEFVETGHPRPLPPALDLTVYRLVQESLTNVLRHAGTERAVVTLRFETAAVVVQVDDDGRGPDPTGCFDDDGRGADPPGCHADDGRGTDPTGCFGDDGRSGGPAAAPVPAGHGLVGMAERVSAVGGRLRVGPAPAGGFQVAAWFPLDGEAVA